VFPEGFENWSGNVKASVRDLLITLRAPNDSGGTNFLLLLRNADNSSGNEYLKEDGVLILKTEKDRKKVKGCGPFRAAETESFRFYPAT
jgi:hypothetical protein